LRCSQSVAVLDMRGKFEHFGANFTFSRVRFVDT
jgi:hypothetical protein